MSRKPSFARHRADTTAKALTAEAQRLGLGVAQAGSPCDALVWYGRVLVAVDWKSPDSGHTLTDAQIKLVSKGFPVRFVGTVAQVEALAADLKREALR